MVALPTRLASYRPSASAVVPFPVYQTTEPWPGAWPSMVLVMASPPLAETTLPTICSSFEL